MQTGQRRLIARQRVKMWGNSLSVRIPKPLAEQLHLRPDSEVELSVRESTLVIKPAPPPAYSLDQLLSQVNDENLHGETNWGPAVGKEVW